MHRGPTMSLAALLILLASMDAGPGSAVQAAPAPAATDSLSAAQRRAIDGFVHRLMAQRLVPGLALAVVLDDTLAYERGYGFADLERRVPVTPETVFYTASLGKAFTGMTAAVLAARGELDLDAPLLDFFPGLTRDAPVRADSVTVRGLLSHSKGFTNGGVNFRTTFVGPIDDAELVRLLNGYSSPAPGFVYSNTAFALADHVITRASGESWRDAMRRLVFAPLGMERSTARASSVDWTTAARPYRAGADGFDRLDFPKTDSTITGAGGIFSSARDLAAFVIANLNQGRYEGRQALPAAAVREAHAAHARLEAEFFEFERFAYGLGFYRARWQGELLVHHFGGYPGFRSHLSFMPEHGVGVVVLQNEGQGSNRVADIVAAYVYDLILGRDADALGAARLDALLEGVAARRADGGDWRDEVRRWSARPATPALDPTAYAGAYTSDRLGTLRLSAAGDRLRLDWGDLDGDVLPVGGDEFVVDWFFNWFLPGAARFRFETDGGRVTALDWGGRVFRKVSGG